MMSYLYGGNAAEIAQAETYFKSLDENINNVTRTPEAIVIDYNNGAQELIPLGTGLGDNEEFVPYDYEGFVGSASPKLTGNANLTTSILEAGTETTYSPIAGKGAGATELPPSSTATTRTPAKDLSQAEKAQAVLSYMQSQRPYMLEAYRRKPSSELAKIFDTDQLKYYGQSTQGESGGTERQ